MFGIGPAQHAANTQVVLRRLAAVHGATFENLGRMTTFAEQDYFLYKNVGSAESAARACRSPLKVFGHFLNVVELPPLTTIRLQVWDGVSPDPKIDICAEVRDFEGIDILPGALENEYVAPDVDSALRLCAPGWKMKLSDGLSVVGFLAPWDPQAVYCDSRETPNVTVALRSTPSPTSIASTLVPRAENTLVQTTRHLALSRTDTVMVLPSSVALVCPSTRAVSDHAYLASDVLSTGQLAGTKRKAVSTETLSSGTYQSPLPVDDRRSLIVQALPPAATLVDVSKSLETFGPLESLHLAELTGSRDSKCLSAYATFKQHAASLLAEPSDAMICGYKCSIKRNAAHLILSNATHNQRAPCLQSGEYFASHATGDRLKPSTPDHPDSNIDRSDSVSIVIKHDSASQASESSASASAFSLETPHESRVIIVRKKARKEIDGEHEVEQTSVVHADSLQKPQQHCAKADAEAISRIPASDLSPTLRLPVAAALACPASKMRRCFNCDQCGHLQSNCPLMKQLNSGGIFAHRGDMSRRRRAHGSLGTKARPAASEARRCFTCGKPGHLQSNCQLSKQSSSGGL